jgi:hypothetical protein
MRTILVLCALSLIIGAVLIWQVVSLPNEYGAFTGAPKADIADLIERPKDFLHNTVAIEGTVRKQCTTMGCYFFFLSGEKMLRVDLEQITMVAPRRNGHTARVEGQMVPYGDGYQFVAGAVEFE